MKIRRRIGEPPKGPCQPNVSIDDGTGWQDLRPVIGELRPHAVATEIRERVERNAGNERSKI